MWNTYYLSTVVCLKFFIKHSWNLFVWNNYYYDMFSVFMQHNNTPCVYIYKHWNVILVCVQNLVSVMIGRLRLSCLGLIVAQINSQQPWPWPWPWQCQWPWPWPWWSWGCVTRGTKWWSCRFFAQLELGVTATDWLRLVWIA